MRLLEGQVWGAAFEAPLFSDTVEVVSQKLVGNKHLRLAVRVGGVMVELALNGLAERELLQLDDERRAAMVSNLLVVLCSDHDATPVINTGTLYA